MKDKIIFFTDLWFYNFGIANFFQKNFDCDMYAIIDVDDKAKKFFQEQDIVKYKKTWFFMDNFKKPTKPNMEYLKSIEKKYDIDLWKLIYADRYFYGYNKFYKFNENELLSIIENECRFYEKILDEVKPDFLSIFYTIHQHQELLRALCVARGIKILMLVTAPFGNKMMITQKGIIMEDIDGLDSSSKKHSMTFDELINYKKKYDSRSVNKDYSKANFKANPIKRYKSILKYFFSKTSESSKNRYSNYGKTKRTVLTKKLSNRFRRISRKNFIDKNFIQKINPTNNYVNFFMHYEPERILSFAAPYFTSQDDIIEKISKSLPVGYELYVKEHPVQETIGWRPISYYKKIMNLPNVKMIHPSVSPDYLLENCSLTITINGTVGIESLFHKKPVVSFTNNFYSNIPSVNVVKNFDDLPNAIRTSLNRTVTADELNDFVNQIESNTFPIRYTLLEADFSFSFGLKGPIVDAELPIEKIKLFLDKYSKEYELIGNEHIKKIKQHKKLN